MTGTGRVSHTSHTAFEQMNGMNHFLGRKGLVHLIDGWPPSAARAPVRGEAKNLNDSDELWGRGEPLLVLPVGLFQFLGPVVVRQATRESLSLSFSQFGRWPTSGPLIGPRLHFLLPSPLAGRQL
jgi:hypothetical protein